MFFGWILLIAVVYLLVKDDPRVNFTQKDSPLQKLKERYINGEIDEETYNRMKSVIHDK
ncbi:SHOCT domain-containing protein [Proteiniclasticum sp. SCR006]|uniref:SHOCT domain-containing protein n=1 Tax=Proteiniclasticum aestuarii TaxID=2817862 RepID=A0A939HAH7_9CLOT|nr:SHOCT domain-containing protein [Proteiniclasticum aestuarii]MBO1265564.1 SHOCT domain-containing protein [Proteiniclasticum aestuarii]